MSRKVRGCPLWLSIQDRFRFLVTTCYQDWRGESTDACRGSASHSGTTVGDGIADSPICDHLPRGRASHVASQPRPGWSAARMREGLRAVPQRSAYDHVYADSPGRINRRRPFLFSERTVGRRLPARSRREATPATGRMQSPGGRVAGVRSDLLPRLAYAVSTRAATRG